MGMLQLNDVLASAQWEPDWTLFGQDHEGLANDAQYVIFEYYCDNPACDCQRLTADIMKLGEDGEPIGKSQAVISYDWSSQERQCAPVLTEESPQTSVARCLLEAYKKCIHCDEYLLRIKSHYARVKQLALEKATIRNTPLRQKIPRNDPCPCGSNKKYKKCCLNT